LRLSAPHARESAANCREAQKTWVFGAFLEKRGHAPSRIEWHFSITGGGKALQKLQPPAVVELNHDNL
jgi:hypothetical protein